jgi:tetratricopeptide (TPR) repeat protein
MSAENAPSGGVSGRARINAWKEIASYLGRDVRTVQRWEKSEGLPVHRHVHESQASVYAFPEELDEWLANRHPVSPVKVPTPVEAAASSKFWRLARIALLAVAALWTSASHEFAPNLQFKERDWVLLGGFENRTGEALLDGTLQTALEAELSNSGFVSVVPRERVEDTLRLMRRPQDTRLDRSLAREVCLRDGNIRVLVTGRTEKLGHTYLLSAEVLDPIRTSSIAADTESAIGQDQIWPAVRRLSNWVQETLGEKMERIERSNRQLEKATTRSLRALQLFTEADTASRRAEWPVAEQLERQALAEDPDFASAHIYLAFALKNQSNPEWKEQAERALALAPSVGDRERYFILGSYESLNGQEERARAAFEALIRLYPDHFFGLRNLVNLYRQLGRIQEAGELQGELADMRPNDFTENYRAADLFYQEDPVRATRYVQRALALAPHHLPSSAAIGSLVALGLFHFSELWMRDDARGALVELDRQRQPPDVDNAYMGQVYKLVVANAYLALGRFENAMQIIETIDEPARSDTLAWIYLLNGDEEHARTRIASVQSCRDLPCALVVARVWGDRALQGISDKPWAKGSIHDAILGEIALSKGKLAEAVRLLQSSFDVGRNRHSDLAPITGDALVTALERSGDHVKALNVLEEASAMRAWYRPSTLPTEFLWLRNQARLSDHYHRLGRDKEAHKIDEELTKLLTVADSDHSILRQLAARRTSAFTPH